MLINTNPIKQKKDIKQSKPKVKTVIHRVKAEPKLQEKTVTINGTALPDDGFDGLSKVMVNVSGGGGFESYKKLYGFSRLDFIEWSVEKYEDDDTTYHPVSIDGYSYMWYLTHKEITNITPGSYTPTIYVDIYRQILEQDNTAVMVAFDSGGYFMIPFLDGFLSI